MSAASELKPAKEIQITKFEDESERGGKVTSSIKRKTQNAENGPLLFHLVSIYSLILQFFEEPKRPQPTI